MVKNAKKRSARVDYRADISVTNGPIDKRQTRMCREMHGLAYAMSLQFSSVQYILVTKVQHTNKT